MDGTPERKSSFGATAGSVFMAFVRVVVVLLAMLILLLAAYFGVVYLYQQVIEPIQNSDLRMDEMENRLQTQRQQIDERLLQFNDRLTALESQSDLRAEDMDQLRVDLEALQTAVTDQALEVRRLNQIESAVSYLATQVMEQRLERFTATPTPTPYGWKGTGAEVNLEALRSDVEVLKALLLIDRARSDLLQDQPEEAENHIRAAQALLAALAEREPADARLRVIPGVTRRLDLALEDVATLPILSAEDLLTAWRVLEDEFIITKEIGKEIEGETGIGPEAAPDWGPTYTPIPTFTTTPTLPPMVTPTAYITPTPR